MSTETILEWWARNWVSVLTFALKIVGAAVLIAATWARIPSKDDIKEMVPTKDDIKAQIQGPDNPYTTDQGRIMWVVNSYQSDQKELLTRMSGIEKQLAVLSYQLQQEREPCKRR
jgi:hypothetical protein